MSGPLSWTLSDVAKATGGVVRGSAKTVVASVTTDSRRATPDSLFAAIRGERHDGHDFAAAAVAAGASATMIEEGRTPAPGAPSVAVRDTLAALRDLAELRRSELSVPTVAVTGSTGKTSTKDLLARVLPNSWASPASYNNEVGVPLTVLGTPSDAEFLVAEVGSRGLGHITWLIPAVRPDVAVITNLGVVHLETFGSVENLAEAKWELVAGLSESGTAVLPAHDERLSADRHPGPVITFGSDRSADVWFEDLEIDPEGLPEFTIGSRGRHHRVRMQMAGRHQPWNAVAATAAALALGVDLDSIAPRLELASGSPGRMEIHHGSVTVVNDAYNANPDSMEAAMRTVAAMPGRHVAVVGLMAELGTVADVEHARIGTLARDLGFAAVVVVGDEPGLADAAGPIARRVEDQDEARRVLASYVRDGDVVLVKASHAVGLERLAAELVEEMTA